MKRTKPSLLTVAYMAIGARRALEELKIADADAYVRAIECNQGELQIIDIVIGYALMADTIADQLEHDTVWSYEVAEPFGAEILRMVRDIWPSTDQAADALRRTLLSADYEESAVNDAVAKWLSEQNQWRNRK